MEQTDQLRVNRDSKQPWIPRKERSWVFLAAGIALTIVLLGLWKIYHTPTGFQMRNLKSLLKNYGSLARLALFVVLANYVFIFILKKQIADRWSMVKKGIAALSRFARKWHVPIAIVAISLIVLHVVGAFLYGIQLDFHNISGLLALIVLLPVPVAGLFRYRKMDRKWHLRLGLAFAFLFLIHAFL